MPTDNGNRQWQQTMPTDNANRQWQQTMATDNANRQCQQTMATDNGNRRMPTVKEQKRQTIVDRTLHKNTKDWVARNPH
jgi:hypothetical protein